MKQWINPFPSYQGYRPGAGAGYIRYDQDTTWYTPEGVRNGRALSRLADEGINARDAGAFYGTRLTWNHVGTNRSVPGTKVLNFVRKSDGKVGFVHDIRDAATLDLMMEVEQIEADAVGNTYYDFRQFGFGILNENSFFGHECPFTTDEILNYWNRMFEIWGRKLCCCVGGSSTYTKPFLEALGKQDNKPGMVNQDDFGREGWKTGITYSAFRGGDFYTSVETWLGYKPMIWWCETEGGPNDFPDDKAANAYKMFLAEKGVFFTNMGARPNYPRTAEFERAVAQYAPARLKQFLEWSQGENGGTEPVEPPSDYVTRAEFDLLKEAVSDLTGAVEVLNKVSTIIANRTIALETHASRDNFTPKA